MKTLVHKLVERRVTLRLATVAAAVVLQLLLTLACVLALRQNHSLSERVEIYRKWAAPLVGREVPPITGVDRTGATRVFAYKDDQRPTLIYSFSKNCGACKTNWTAMRAIQQLSPSRLRVVYFDPFDELTEAFLLEHGLAQDVLFTKLDPLSAASYQIRGTPQTELVDKDGRVLWASIGAFGPSDLAALMEAVEEHERQRVEAEEGAGK